MADLSASNLSTMGNRAADIIRALPNRSDLSLAVAILGIIVVLILPLPSMLLDLFLAISFIFSILILMTSLFIKTPLEFSVFPTVLLVATLLRLALNLASTRLILANGHTGTNAAGDVIEAFGNFIMQGNIVIGVIVFGILVIVNFVVITKGSGRIAEVSARFSLDAMPGKQMAIDADLSAGLISEDIARSRRTQLEDESAFFGSMDGASKFVRGDAIAGLLVTIINIVGGIVVGVGQNGLNMSEAAQTYVQLTIGDGLVTQIPSLIVSVAAGLLVSKSGVTGAADTVLIAQFSNYPKALGLSSMVMIVMGLLPGLPGIPFFALGAAAGFFAYTLSSVTPKIESTDPESGDKTEETPSETPLSDTLKMDDLKIELGLNLIELTRPQDDSEGMAGQIKALRRQFAIDMGFVTPPVRLVDNVAIDANTYVIKIKEIQAGSGMLRPGECLVMDPEGGQIDMPGTPTMEPTFGLPATWVAVDLQDEAREKGYTVVDSGTVLATHLNELVKSNMAEILSYSTVQSLLNNLEEGHKKLIDELIPDVVSVSVIQRVLQALVTERVSIRDLPTILEAIAEIAPTDRSTTGIVSHVRSRLSRQLCAEHTGSGGYLPLISLSPVWEEAFLTSIAGEGESRHLAMAPSKLQEFVEAVRASFDEAARQGELPVLLTGAETRPFVRSIIERFRRQTSVLSQAEIHPQARLKTIDSI